MGLYGLTILVLYALSLRLDKPTYLFNSLIYPSLINIDLIFNNSSDNWWDYFTKTAKSLEAVFKYD